MATINEMKRDEIDKLNDMLGGWMNIQSEASLMRLPYVHLLDMVSQVKQGQTDFESGYASIQKDEMKMRKPVVFVSYDGSMDAKGDSK